ncbi:probable serine/threonine-protein kinase At1g54610 isoform X2 [Ipomoea triloba]|uniref:probable serine/threonine-protein kinase At1g54610 isoform X2 n=1 Tax=Ipomoea triloba TaxID=35885 RepID=UPI00125E7DD6|nr:probable serine/threonine-protein kinase At1g54610 isoform X2 [Ipomoea triloba]
MGCVFGKASPAAKERVKGEKKRERVKGEKKREWIKGSPESRVTLAISSKRKESFRRKEKEKGEARKGSVDKKGTGSRKVRDDNFEQIKEKSEVIISGSPGYGKVPNAVEGELVAAGWPSWLSMVASEAIIGWLPRKADTFEKLDKIGQGTYSSVYKARDLVHNKVVALKRVRFDNMDPESVKFMAREIQILRRLDHPNVIKLEGMVTSRTSCSLYLVFEYMEHDLTGLTSLPGVKFTEPQVKCYMQQLLRGLDHCHTRGVLHRDIKGSNLLIDDEGTLKIADFGLATFFDHQQSATLTSRVVTLWYRPPELLLGATHYGVAVDMWSAGCILGELYTGKPIMAGRTEVEQLHKIFKICGSPSEDYWRKEKLPHSTVFKPLQPYRRRITEAFKDLPPTAVGLMETLLSIDPAQRGTAASALESDLFTTKPFACDASSLPKYPPSKEIDAKLREEEARRQAALEAKKGQMSDKRSRGGSKEIRGVLASNVNAMLTRPMKMRQHKSNSKSISEQFNPHKESASGFPIDAPRPPQAVRETCKDHPEPLSERYSHSGPLAPAMQWANSGKKYDDISIGSIRANLSKLTGLVASRSALPGDSQDRLGVSRMDSANEIEVPVALLEAAVRNQDQKHYVQNFAGSRHIESRKPSAKEPAPHECGVKGNKAHFSGPLLVSSNRVEQLLREHDRRIQEAARRSRIEKARLDRAHAQGMQTAANSIYISSLGRR